MKSITSFLKKAPYALAAVCTDLAVRFLETRWPHVRYWALVPLALFCFLAFKGAPKIRESRLARRRMFEAAFCVLAAIQILAGRWGWFQWVSFPFFLLLVYADYRWTELLFLLGIQGFCWRSPAFFLLAAWTALSVGFRALERKKRKGVSERLGLYEREARSIAAGSEGLGAELRVEEKKSEHLAAVLRQREETFKNLTEILRRTIRPHTAAFYLFDPVGDTFILKEVSTDSDRFAHQKVQRAEGIFRALLREEGVVGMVSETGELRGLLYYAGPPLVRSVIAVPVKSDGVLKGVVILDRLSADGFSPEETETAGRVAAQLAAAIDNTEALHAYFHLKEELSSFYAASSALNRSLKIEDALEALLASVRRIVPYDTGAVVLYDAAADTNRVAAEGGDEKAGWTGETFACAPERGLVSWAVKNQAPLSYTDFRSRGGKTALFHQRWKTPNVYDSVLIVPMQVKGEPLGAALFLSRRNHAFSKTVRKMIEVVATQAAVSVKNARMVEELRKLANTDGLTGLTNHRTFQGVLFGELERSARHPAPTSLLLIDIDHFKRFNDEYGHPVGDYVLREIGRVLSRTVRKVDTVARYGGEEFAVVLVHAEAAGARQMADRIVQTVAKTAFQYDGLSLRVSVSVGAATSPADARQREDLIEAADRALYEAKRLGRNRAVAYDRKLGKMNAEEAETRLIEAAEDGLRRMVDHPSLPV